jgi:hypothetical protein
VWLINVLQTFSSGALISIAVSIFFMTFFINQIDTTNLRVSYRSRFALSANNLTFDAKRIFYIFEAWHLTEGLYSTWRITQPSRVET